MSKQTALQVVFPGSVLVKGLMGQISQSHSFLRLFIVNLSSFLTGVELASVMYLEAIYQDIYLALLLRLRQTSDGDDECNQQCSTKRTEDLHMQTWCVFLGNTSNAMINLT